MYNLSFPLANSCSLAATIASQRPELFIDKAVMHGTPIEEYPPVGFFKGGIVSWFVVFIFHS